MKSSVAHMPNDRMARIFISSSPGLDKSRTEARVHQQQENVDRRVCQHAWKQESASRGIFDPRQAHQFESVNTMRSIRGDMAGCRLRSQEYKSGKQHGALRLHERLGQEV